jgi:hypothetical protein
MTAFAISSGHGKKIRGASGYLDEVDEARRVVARVAEILNAFSVGVKTFNDDVSTSQNENLNRIVDWHNAQKRDLDVSVHFNAYQTTSKPMGTECLYVTQQTLASEVAKAIADAGGLINRGPKKRTDLFFLNKTSKPSILVEVCFVDSSTDEDLYDDNFEAICGAIASAISGQSVESVPPTPEVPPPEGGGGEPEQHPTVKKGDKGPPVVEVQTALYVTPIDGDFGSITESAVKNFQRTSGLDDDGIVGPQTWAAIDALVPGEPLPLPPGALPPLTAEDQAGVIGIVTASKIYRYNWKDRGIMPPGYSKGLALTWANTVRKFHAGDSAVKEMAKADTRNDDKDALSWYRSNYAKLGLDNEQAGIHTLRHLFMLVMGLGMRESSGRHCCGRDQSASNTTSDTCEAGAWQTSWNAHSCSSQFDKLFDDYQAGGQQCFLEVFKEGVSCSSADWSNYGSGNGAEFQRMCKECPPFAAETAAVGLRNLRQHWGPINRKEAELVLDADEMLLDVQEYIEALGPSV